MSSRYGQHQSIKRRVWVYQFKKDDPIKLIQRVGRFYTYEYGEDLIICPTMQQVRLDMQRLHGYMRPRLDLISEPIKYRYGVPISINL